MAEWHESLGTGNRQCHICEEGGQSVASEYVCLNCKQRLCLDCRELHKIIKTTRLHNILSIDESLTEDWKSTCDICKERGQYNVAPFLCLSCEQYLCEACKQYHMRVKATRLHEIREKATLLHEIREPCSGSASFKTPMCEKHDCSYEYFCKTDMECLCLECKLAEHGSCEVIGIEDASKECCSISDCENHIQSLENIIKDLSAQNDVMKAKEGTLWAEKQTLVAKLRHLRTAFDTLLNKLEANAIAEIDLPFYEKLNKITEQVRENNEFIVVLQNYVSDIRKAVSNTEDVDMLIVMSTVGKGLQKLDYKDWQEKTGNMDEDEIHKNYIANLKECMSSLLTLSEINVSSELSFSEENIKVNSSLTITTEKGEESPEILSYAVLQNEKELILDIINSITAYGIAYHTELL